jgi:hypothetical protein
MKTTLLLVAAVALVCGGHNATAGAQKKTPVTPPQGVAPARPDIPLPRYEDQWHCWLCGSSNPLPKKHYKDPMHRPMPAPDVTAGVPPYVTDKLAAELLLERSVPLQLSDKQSARLENIISRTRKALSKKQSRLERELTDLQELIASGSHNMSRIERQLNAVARSRVDVQSERISAWIHTRKVLNDEQKEILRQRFPGVAEVLQ